MAESQACRPEEALIGESPAIRRISDQLHKAALTDVPVLITGESGTGKELAARMLHRSGTRHPKNFFKVSCPAIPDQFFESDLFGHDDRSPAAADSPATTLGESTYRGTLFLDEIGELEHDLQPKLLYALQDLRVARLGTIGESSTGIRLVCASTHDLEADVSNGRFRKDLFYRINVIRLHMPPLRERPSDVRPLFNYFIATYSAHLGVRPRAVSSFFLKVLSSYHWPGNIRELKNMAKRFVVLGEEENVLSMIRQREELRPLLPAVLDLTSPLRVQTKRAIEHTERAMIWAVLEANRWNRRQAARSLDISYRTLLYKLQVLGLPAANPCSPGFNGPPPPDSYELNWSKST